ncbi:MAG: hypothetical protein K0Q59_2106 [Paenibacillus sp.]|nr:hypothetical protein [Paenibacillus sp.]
MSNARLIARESPDLISNNSAFSKFKKGTDPQRRPLLAHHSTKYKLGFRFFIYSCGVTFSTFLNMRLK